MPVGSEAVQLDSCLGEPGLDAAPFAEVGDIQPDPSRHEMWSERGQRLLRASFGEAIDQVQDVHVGI